jgi:hypothetical protein
MDQQEVPWENRYLDEEKFRDHRIEMWNLLARTLKEYQAKIPALQVETCNVQMLPDGNFLDVNIDQLYQQVKTN